MALNVFRATALGAFVATSLKARETDLPSPPPTTLIDLPCHGYIRFANSSSDPDPPDGCGTNITSETYCPSLSVPGFNGGSSIEFVVERLYSQLSWKNFPLEVYDKATGNLLLTVPALSCDPQYWGGGAWEVVSATQAFSFTFDDFYTGATAGRGTYLLGLLCQKGPLAVLPVEGVWIGVRVTLATWGITGFDAGTGWIIIGVHYLRVGDLVELTGMLLNGGRHGVLEVDHSGGRIRIDFQDLVQEDPTGNVVLIPGRFARCGDFTAISQVDQGLYPPVMQYTGPALGAVSQDQIVLLTDSGVYDGLHTISIAGLSPGEVILTDTTWQGSPPSGGTWVNNAVILVSSDTLLGDRRMRVVGSSGVYDGIYEAGDLFPVSDPPGMEVTGQSFTVTETGTMEFSGISFSGTNIPFGFFTPITITISGTASYDGTYDCQILFTSFVGGDLDNVFFEGSQTGTWVEVGDPTNTGLVTSVGGGTNTADYTSVQADKSGAVTDIVSNHIRVTSPGHDVAINEIVYLETGAWVLSAPDYSYVPGLYDDEARTVAGVIAGLSFDVDGRYVGTATGHWTAEA